LASTVTVPLLLPLAGETVAHGWLELAVQLRFEVTVIAWICSVADTVVDAGLIMVAGAVVTVSVTPSEVADPTELETTAQ